MFRTKRGRRLQKLDKDYAEHVREVKIRSLLCIIYFFVVLCVCCANAEKIIDMSLEPCRSAGFCLISVRPGDSVIAGIIIVLALALLATLPFAFLQVTAFVLPAVKPSDVIKIRLIMYGVALLFLAGILFSFYVILPFFFRFMSEYGRNRQFTNDLSISEYVSFICDFSLCMGLVFQMPLLVISLWKFGLVDKSRLKKFRGIFYIFIFIGAALITPPDVISQLMVALPMIGLFETGNICGRFVMRR